MLKLRINDSDIELKRGEVVAITLQANSIEKPDSFQSSFSNSFDVVLTRANRSPLGNLFAMGNSGLEFERITGTSLVQDGLQIVSDGFAVVEEYNNQIATLTVYSGVNDFFEELGDLNMQQLTALFTLSSEKTLTAVTNSQSNDYTDGFIWAIANYGEVLAGDVTIDIRYQHPSLFVKALHEYIAQETTWAFAESDFYIDSFFEKLVTPFNNPKPFAGSFFGIRNTVSTTTGGTQTITYETFEDANNWQAYNTTPSVLNEGIANNNIIRLKINGELQDFTTPDSVITIKIMAIPFGGDETTAVEVASNTVTTGSTTPFDLETTYTAINDTRAFFGQITTFVPGAILFQYDAEFNSGRIDTDFLDYAFYKSVPNMKVSDYLKGIWLMFGIVPQIDFTTKEIALKNFEAFTTDYANSIDYSNKVDISKEILIENKYGDWGNSNTFAFEPNPDIPNSELNDGRFLISNALLDSEYEWIKLPFSVSSQTLITADDVICVNINVYDTQALTNEASERIGYISYYNSSPLPVLNLTDGLSTNNNVNFAVCKFFDVAEGFDLRYSGLEANYFDSLIKTVQAMQKLTVYLKLNSIDFNNIDFFVPYYLSFSFQNVQIRGYYYLQLIDEYKAGESAKCEFIRLNPF